MKTALLFVLSFTALSTVSFAQTDPGEGPGNLVGSIRQMECNGPTGLGIVEIAIRKGRTLESHVLKVDSRELCSPSGVEDFGSLKLNSSVLSRIAWENQINRNTFITEVTIQDGYVVAVENLRQEDYIKYVKGVKKYKTVGNSQEIYNWYFANRKSR